jgi:hypothetical protein
MNVSIQHREPFVLAATQRIQSTGTRAASHAFLSAQLFLSSLQQLSEIFRAPWHGWHAPCNFLGKRDAKRFDSNLTHH